MLRNTLSHLLKMTAGYSLNTLIGPIFTIVLTPIYTRILNPADYGTVDTLLMLGNIISIIGILGLTTALPAVYYDSDDEGQKRQVLSSALWTAVLWSMLITLIVLIAARPITSLALDEPELTSLTWLLALGQPGAVAYAIQTTVLRLRFAVWRANILALIYLLLFVGLNVLFIVGLGWGVPGVITAHTLTNVAIGLASLAIAHESLRSLPRPRTMIYLARTGLPILPAGLALWLLIWQDRLFLARTVTFAEIGLYSVANKLASMLYLLVIPFRSAWEPLALSIQKEHEAPRTYAKILTYYTVTGLGLALAIALFAREILLIFTTPEYLGASNYVWLLIVIPLSSGFQAIISIGLLIEKRLGRLGWALMIAAAVNTLLNAILIPFFAVWGAAIATCLGYLVILVLVARSAQRTHPFPFQWMKLITVLLVYLILAVLGVLLSERSDLLTICLRGMLLVAYLPILWALQLFETHEVQLAARALREPGLLLRRLRGAR